MFGELSPSDFVLDFGRLPPYRAAKASTQRLGSELSDACLGRGGWRSLSGRERGWIEYTQTLHVCGVNVGVYSIHGVYGRCTWNPNMTPVLIGFLTVLRVVGGPEQRSLIGSGSISLLYAFFCLSRMLEKKIQQKTYRSFVPMVALLAGPSFLGVQSRFLQKKD